MIHNELIRSARLAKGLTAVQVAERIGLTIAAYRDLEQHSDEATSAIPMALLSRLCAELGIEMKDFSEDHLISEERVSHISRAELLKLSREKLKMTEDDVANAIGFDVKAVYEGEAQSEYLDSLPLSVIIEWARTLRISPRQLFP